MPPRLPPLPVEKWDDDVRRTIDDNRALLLLPEMPNSVTTLLHHPRLASAWFHYNTVLLRSPALTDRLRELAILRAMWLSRSRYMWIDHVRYALNLGIAADDIAAIASGTDDERWTPIEAAVIAATDELVDHWDIDDATWARLADHLDEAQLLELPFVVGSYLTLGMVYTAARTDIDDFLEAIPTPVMPPER